MTQSLLFWLIACACLLVAGVLTLGIGSFAKSGDFNRKYANKLMQWRLGLQFIAVILIVGFAYLTRG